MMIVFGTTVEIANSDDPADPHRTGTREAAARRPNAGPVRAARDDPPPTPPAAGDRANVRLRAGQSVKPFLTTSEIRADPRFYKFLKLTSKMPSAVRQMDETASHASDLEIAAICRIL